MEEGLPDRPSYDRDMGTAAHLLGATCLREGTVSKEYRHLTIVVDAADGDAYFEKGNAAAGHAGSKFLVDDDMVLYVGQYVEQVRTRIKALELLGAKVTLSVECALPISSITGEEGAEGTGDVVVVAEFPDRVKLCVEDLKYGRGVEVSAESNKQLAIYALGALDKFDIIYDITEVELVIYQPRISAGPSLWSPTLAELREFGHELTLSSQKVWQALVTKERSSSSDDRDALYLHESEEACRFCKAKAHCPAATGRVQAELSKEFTDLTTSSVPEQKDIVATMMPPIDQLGAKMDAIPLIEMWCKAVRAAAETELLAGRHVAGYKLVQGRQGNRAWSDAVEAEAILKSMRLKSALKLEEDPIYDRTLISPTQCEKLLATESPKRWARVVPLVSRTEGKPSVAPVSDKRPELSLVIEAEFEVIKEIANPTHYSGLGAVSGVEDLL
jgi:hypothetical protein